MTQPPASQVKYKGEPLDADRGPGLGCFRFQVAVLAFVVVLTPLSVAWHWPEWLSALLLFAVIGLLLVAGQTIIFLLRLVAADRRATGRRRPLASATRTVGELEDDHRTADGGSGQRDGDDGDQASMGEEPGGGAGTPSDGGPVRQ